MDSKQIQDEIKNKKRAEHIEKQIGSLSMVAINLMVDKEMLMIENQQLRDELEKIKKTD